MATLYGYVGILLFKTCASEIIGLKVGLFPVCRDMPVMATTLDH